MGAKAKSELKLWINTDGRTVCIEHGGYSLQASLERNPTAMHVTTTLDDWIAFTGRDIDDFDLRCEHCPT